MDSPRRASVRYLVISPVRNESCHIGGVMASVIGQSIRPTEWIIVDDGSKDGTARIAEEHAGRHPWIRIVRRPDRGYHEPGRGVMEAFYDGYERRTCRDFEFLVKLDGDLTFAPDYFESLFERFAGIPRLGMASGVCYVMRNGSLEREKHPVFHVRGPSKVYRRACWDQIGGLVRHLGWDTIDEIEARRRGWDTRSFEDIRILHHRATGSVTGAYRWSVKTGKGAYYCGYHPLFAAAKGVRRLFMRPYLIGGVGFLAGFMGSTLRGDERYGDEGAIRYLRREQLKRIFLNRGIWK